MLHFPRSSEVSESLEPNSSPRISQEIRASRVGRHRPLTFTGVGAGCPDDQKGGRRLPSVPSHALNAPQRRHGSFQPRKVERQDKVANSWKRDDSIPFRRRSARFLLSESCHNPSLATVRSPVPGERWCGGVPWWSSGPLRTPASTVSDDGVCTSEKWVWKNESRAPLCDEGKRRWFFRRWLFSSGDQVFDVLSLTDAVVNDSPAPTLLALTWGSADWGGGA